MSRKRSIFSLFDNLDKESSLSQFFPTAHPYRNRLITSIIGEKTVLFIRSSSNIRKKNLKNTKLVI